MTWSDIIALIGALTAFVTAIAKLVWAWRAPPD